MATPSSAGTRPDPPAGPAAATPRPTGGRSVRDMALSMLVLLLPIFGAIWLWQFLSSGNDATVVDPAPVLAEASTADRFPVAEPTGLASGWRATSATLDHGDGGLTIRIGYLTPDDDGVLLLQSDLSSEKLLPAELGAQARPDGTVAISGKDWQVYAARDGERALVLLEPRRTIVVIGRVPDRELRALAGALR